jgi:hypothetical protein
MPRTFAPRRGGWTPPQTAALVGAWVRGLSGDVAKLGVWPGQYGTAQGLTLAANAAVDANGLTVAGGGDKGTAVGLAQADVPWTISFWVRQIAVQPATAAVVTHGDYAHGMWINAVNAGTRNIGWYTGTSGGLHFTAGIADAAWHLVTVTNDNLPPFGMGTGCKLYVDGQPAGTYGNQSIDANANAFTAGAGSVFGSWFYFRGNLDCIYYWQGAALTAAEVVKLWSEDPHRRGNL